MNCACRQGVISFGKTVNCARRELYGVPANGDSCREKVMRCPHYQRKPDR